MDMITLALAKQYTDSQKLAYTEGGGSLIWDGNTEGKEVYNENFVRVSTKALDLNEIATVTLSENGEVTTIAASEGNVIVDNGASLFIADVPLIISVSVAGTADFAYFDVGTYLFTTPEADAYVSSVTFKETIHPIDPKYLPGVCLPVVELSTVIAESGTALTEAESAALTEAYESGLPIVCKFSQEDVIERGVFQWVSANDATGYSMVSSSGIWILVKTDTGWVVIRYD